MYGVMIRTETFRGHHTALQLMMMMMTLKYATGENVFPVIYLKSSSKVALDVIPLALLYRTLKVKVTKA